MEPNPYPTYEDAARDYLSKFTALTHTQQEPSGTVARGSVELPAETLNRLAEEIAGISAAITRLVQEYLDSPDPNVREGIRYHLIVQSTAELLLGVEILQISEEAGLPSTAAIKATHRAALREAISAIEKSSSAPVAHGLPTDASYRASESTTMAEAVSGLRLAIESTASSNLHRVQELGGDIAFDLVSGTQWDEVIRGASLSLDELSTIMDSIHKDAAAKLLLQVYRTTLSLLRKEIAGEARLKIQEWLNEIKQVGRMDVFNSLIDKLYNIEALKKSVSAIGRSDVPLDSINKASDLVKAFSDRFIILIGRMRKLEDAIRLGKSIEIPQFRLLTIALQVALLSALVYTGQDYIDKGLVGILRDRGLV